jgi:hypothetical protein
MYAGDHETETPVGRPGPRSRSAGCPAPGCHPSFDRVGHPQLLLPPLPPGSGPKFLDRRLACRRVRALFGYLLRGRVGYVYANGKGLGLSLAGRCLVGESRRRWQRNAALAWEYASHPLLVRTVPRGSSRIDPALSSLKGFTLRPPGLKPSLYISWRSRGLESPLPRTKVRGYTQPAPRGLERLRKKFARRQKRQGLKPDLFPIVYGRLKSCPDIKQSFSAARKVAP